MWQISHFCEIHSLSYEASKFFAMLSLFGFFGRYFAPGANIVPPIAYKSHSTPFPIRPHVLTPHSWLCDKNCGRSSAPKKKWNLEMADNTNVALPYMASTIKYLHLACTWTMSALWEKPSTTINLDIYRSVEEPWHHLLTLSAIICSPQRKNCLSNKKKTGLLTVTKHYFRFSVV